MEDDKQENTAVIGDKCVSKEPTEDTPSKQENTEMTCNKSESKELMEVTPSTDPSIEDSKTGKDEQKSACIDADTGVESGSHSVKSAIQISLEEQDPFFYLKRKEFTSEIYKIQITNLPRFGFSQFKKKLASFGINPRKIKALPNKNIAWVTFSCEEERVAAQEKLDGHEWKKFKLKVKKADPSQDPLVKRQRERDDRDKNEPDSKKSKEDTDSSENWEEKLRLAVSPLWNMPYEEQLKLKTSEMTTVMKHMTGNLRRQITSPDMLKEFDHNRSVNDGICCSIMDIKPSPVTELYRNKCEFNIGTSPNGEDNTIGHSFGLYKEGYNAIGSPQHLTLMPKRTLNVVKHVQECIRAGPYTAYNTSTHEGCWRTLTVRVNQKDEVMAILRIAYKFVDEKLAAEKQRIASYFTGDACKECSINSFYFVQQRYMLEKRSEDVYEKATGQDFIIENLLGMNFRISPDSFFQVNTPAAEILYSQVQELCDLVPNSVLLDICCGTGTIGLTMASSVKRVIGIEMCKQAVDDAMENAKMNDIKNVTYICEKVENCIKDAIRKHAHSRHIVAVVDPPRAGLHTSVIRCLRSCHRIDRLVYVSCSPKSAVPNFIDLMKSPTKRMKGDPFNLLKVIPVDLFPQTKLCELILVFDRHAVTCDSDREIDTSVSCEQSGETSEEPRVSSSVGPPDIECMSENGGNQNESDGCCEERGFIGTFEG